MPLRTNRSRLSLGLLPLATLGSLFACSGSVGFNDDDNTPGAGGNLPAGGTSTAGGASNAGGRANAGGGPNAGGGLANAGGTPNAGGAGNTGGGSGDTGGSNTGGGANVGGGPAAGGSASGGGSNPGGGEWGKVENPSAGCTIGPLPSFSSLTANSKLPDPFKKMDGTRITTKAEWLCRREEILQQMYEFIYGDKPAPEEVSGTVSTSSISVQARGTSGTANFSVTVDMNGATAPAPAIIRYSTLGAAPIPSGVAVVTFSAVESEGGSGAKNGPFYTAYGSNHPAGYLAAQAWQVSRILDVLEQNPGTIDPYRVGVTGCSRLGKGAFVAGVLDNRIALTIPVESGLGGTVGLRLVEQLDTSGEWPYHGISYVRWLSEVALGPFTSGNSAGADNTDKLPVDMHEAMGLIAPRGLYIVDNPSTNYAGLDKNSAWVTGKVGQMIFEGLGVGDHIAYQGASGGHCSWRSQYDASLDAMINKFLKGNAATETGNFATDLPNPPNHLSYVDWETPTLSGEL